MCVQIKGEIQTSLGQWLTAATHLLESINLFKTLPKIDKKGVASSLGLMVNTLQNMSMDDYQTIATKYSLKSPHPFPLAYDFACEAASYSTYTPLCYARPKVSLFTTFTLPWPLPFSLSYFMLPTSLTSHLSLPQFTIRPAPLTSFRLGCQFFVCFMLASCWGNDV